MLVWLRGLNLNRPDQGVYVMYICYSKTYRGPFATARIRHAFGRVSAHTNGFMTAYEHYSFRNEPLKWFLAPVEITVESRVADKSKVNQRASKSWDVLSWALFPFGSFGWKLTSY
jgi:hypothetical protein